MIKGTITVAALLFALGVTTACAPEEVEDAQPDSSSSLDQAHAERLQELFKGTFAEPEGNAPTPPNALDVWVISCGEQVTLCSRSSAGAKEAGAALGWQVNVFDTQGNLSQASSGIREAIAAGADAIVAWQVDCSNASAAYHNAHEEGVMIVGAESLDCDFPNTGEAPVFDGELIYEEGSFDKWMYDYGAMQAAWIVAKSNGKAETIAFMLRESLGFQLQVDGFIDEYKKCADCILHEIPVTFDDIGSKLQAKAAQALIKFPASNSAYALFDGMITGGIGPAIAAANRGDLNVMGGEGLAPAPALARIGIQQDAGAGFAPEWEAYAAMDAIIRLKNDQPVGRTGIGLQAWDKDNNLPADATDYVPPVDFRSFYKKSWSLG